MQKTLLLLVLLALGAQAAHGQAFEKGYLVLQRGDTLRGEIENAFWEEPAKVVRFRATPTAPLVAYTSHQLRSVSLASGRLLRKEYLTIDRDSETRLAYLSTALTHQLRPDSVLADVLVQGPATLLGISLHETKHFFVQRPGQPYLELAEHNYLLFKEGIQRIADANNFKGQLQLYFGDCEAVTTLLPGTAFTEEGMQRVVRTYNRQCSGVPQLPEIPTVAAASRPRITVRSGAVVGLRYNSMRLISTNGPSDVLHGYNADGRLHPLAGIYTDVVAGGRRFAFHTALQVSQLGHSQPLVLPSTAYNPASTYEWSGTLVALQFGLRGFLPIGPHMQLIVGGGYEVNSYWGVTSEYNNTGTISDFVYPFVGTPLPYLEAGLSRNRWAATLNGRVYYSDYFYQYTYQPWSMSLMLSYRLNADSDALPKAGR